MLKPVLASALLLFFLPLAPAEPLDTAFPDQPHDPIRIDGDQDLLLPDSISGNGVRSGVGTAASPYLIENWDFDLESSEVAIEIRNVDAHVTIAGITIAGDLQSSGGIHIFSSSNITILDAELESLWLGIGITGSHVKMGGIDIRDTHRDYNDTTSNLAPPAIAAGAERLGNGQFRHGSLEIRDVTISHAWAGITIAGHAATVAGAAVSDVVGHGLVFNGNNRNELQARRISVDGPCPSAGQGQEILEILREEDDCGNGLWVHSTPYASLHELQATGWGNGIALGTATQVDASAWNASNNSVGVRSSAIHGSLNELTITDNGVGILQATFADQELSDVHYHRMQVTRNAFGFRAFHATAEDTPPEGQPQRLRISESDIVANERVSVELDSRNRPDTWPSDYELDARGNYWGPDGPQRSGPNAVVGSVATDGFSEKSFFDVQYNTQGPGENTPAASVMFVLAVLGCVGLVRRASDPRGRRP